MKRTLHNLPGKRIGMGLFIGIFWIAGWAGSACAALDATPSLAELESKPDDFEIEVRTDGPWPQVVHAGEPFQWKIVVRWYGDLDAVAPEIQKLPEWQGVDLVSSSTVLKNGSESDRRYAEKAFVFTLKAPQPGEASIGTAAMRYRRSAQEESAFVNTPLQALTVLPAPFSFSRWLREWWGRIGLPVLAVALVGGLIVGVTFFRRHRIRKMSTVAASEVESDPVAEAFEKARRFRIEGEIQPFVQMLERAVQASLQKQQPEGDAFSAAEWKECAPPDQQVVFDRFVRFCEEAKYAPIPPSAEALDRVWEDARRLAGAA